jgi:hypothetical protein
MKLGHATTIPGGHSCQQPGCPNMDLRKEGMGKPRSQSCMGIIRTLYLCDECFERLSAHQLHDLCLRFVVSLGSDQHPHRETIRLAVKS